jgi:hypothetical protein
MLDLQLGWYLNIKNWPENSQNYSEFSLILIGSIFHFEVRVVGNSFAVILSHRLTVGYKPVKTFKKPIKTTQNNLS